MRIVMLASVALNLLLATTLVGARVDRNHGSPEIPPVPSTASGPARDTMRPASSPAMLLHSLEASGFPASDIRPMLFGWLSARYRSAWHDEGPDFWQTGFSPARLTVSHDFAVADRVREALLGLFGAAAQTEPAFDAVFRPLDPAFAFLTSSEQLELERARYEQLGASAMAPPNTLAACSRPVSVAGATADALPASAMPPLPPDALEEYLLRFSQPADGLRRAGLASETQFRAAFALLRQLGQEAAPARQVELRQALRELVGDSAFNAVWSQSDPRFAEVERELASAGFGASEIDAAYEVLSRGQEALMSLFAREPGDAVLIAEAGSIERDIATALERLLGKADAAALRSAISRAEIGLSIAQSGSC